MPEPLRVAPKSFFFAFQGSRHRLAAPGKHYHALSLTFVSTPHDKHFFAAIYNVVMPRYVILEHDHPFLHWDVMLEIGTALRTWRLAAPPTSSSIITAQPLGDHRLAYLDYEGPVSGNRGTVKRWDRGDFELISESEGQLAIRLCGRRFNGTATLRRTGTSWELTCQ
jgi:hypothetical protein